MGDGHIGQARRPGGHLIQRAVAAAGIKPQGTVRIFLRLLADLGNGVAGVFRGEDLIIHPQLHRRGPDAGGHLIGSVALAGGGIDDEDMLYRCHAASPLKYI